LHIQEEILRPKAIMLVGLPGSGKSTLYKTHDPDGNFHHYSTDAEIAALAIRDGKTHDQVFPDCYPEALKTANDKLEDALSRQANIVFDQTNLSYWKRVKTLAKLPEIYYKIGLVLLPPGNIDELKALKTRLDNRPASSAVPWSTIVRMMETFDMPTITEGFDELGFYNPFQHSADALADCGERTDIDVIFRTFQFAKQNIVDPEEHIELMGA
jgi:predicted kinase